MITSFSPSLLIEAALFQTLNNNYLKQTFLLQKFSNIPKSRDFVKNSYKAITRL